MATTEIADYKFTVKEGSVSGSDDARVFLMCEPMTNELSFVSDNEGFLCIHLNKGIKIGEAQEIATYLQDRVTGISFTRF